MLYEMHCSNLFAFIHGDDGRLSFLPQGWKMIASLAYSHVLIFSGCFTVVYSPQWPWLFFFNPQKKKILLYFFNSMRGQSLDIFKTNYYSITFVTRSALLNQGHYSVFLNEVQWGFQNPSWWKCGGACIRNPWYRFEYWDLNMKWVTLKLTHFIFQVWMETIFNCRRISVGSSFSYLGGQQDFLFF